MMLVCTAASCTKEEPIFEGYDSTVNIDGIYGLFQNICGSFSFVNSFDFSFPKGKTEWKNIAFIQYYTKYLLYIKKMMISNILIFINSNSYLLKYLFDTPNVSVVFLDGF